MTRTFRNSLIAALAVSTLASGASAAIRLPSIPGLPKFGDDRLVSCVASVPDNDGAVATGVFGTDGATNRNLRSTFSAAPVEPTYTPGGQRARTPFRALSNERPDGVILTGAYTYVPAANGQMAAQLEYIQVRAPFLVRGGAMPSGRNAPVGDVRVSFGDLVYSGQGRLADGGLEFRLAARHAPEVGFVEIRQEDQLAFARAAVSQTPFEIVVNDRNTKEELYRARSSLAPGAKQKSMMDLALSLASAQYAKGFNNKLCNP